IVEKLSRIADPLKEETANNECTKPTLSTQNPFCDPKIANYLIEFINNYSREITNNNLDKFIKEVCILYFVLTLYLEKIERRKYSQNLCSFLQNFDKYV